ncbi:hypothetical protein [Sphingobacterium kyonggiense]
MQPTIDKILVVINECKDPIKNTPARKLRDDALTVLAKDVMHMTDKELDAYARNDDEAQSLGWFYTRFVHNRRISARGDNMDKPTF